MVQSLNRSCPLCNSSSRSEKKSVRRYTIVACDNCGFLYVANPEPNTVSEEDVDISKARHTAVPQPRRRHHYIKRLIERKFKGTADLLEVGAGYGALGKLLEKYGHSYVGFEPSETRATVASNDGVDVIEGYYRVEAVDRQFDAAILDNVIEHVLEPKQLLQDVYEALKPDGVVIVIVPSRYDLRRLHPGWNDKHFWIPESHVNFFKPNDLRRLYSTIGLHMHPFPSKAFGTKHKKDILFRLKARVETAGIFPASLYTYGSTD